MTPHRAGRWSLEDLIAAPSGPPMEGAFDELERAVADVEAAGRGLDAGMPVDRFAEWLTCVERAAYEAQRLRGYAALWFSEQANLPDALALRQRVDGALAAARNRQLPYEHWWQRLEPSAAERLLAASGDCRYYLETLRRFAPYTLSDAEERVINLKDVHGVRGIATVYEMLTHGLSFDLSIDGEAKTLTRAELMAYARSPKPEHREAAYEALFRVHVERKDVLAQLYRYIVGDWTSENVTLRGMASPISARNLRNDLPDDIVDAILRTCRENASLYQRFFRLKASWLGVERLRRVDVYAPLEGIDRNVPFEEGAQWVLESLSGFSPQLAELAERVLAERHLDAIPRPGKDTGAFCYGVVPDKTPWVSVNYAGRVDHVATLGHELGHAVHAMTASGHSPLTFRSSLPLAETASNFVEILLLYRMLDDAADPEMRRYLLAKFVDDSYASILRQAYFVLFEREAHRLIHQENATGERLSETYFAQLQEQFGDSVELSDAFRWEWISIPHIYATPFYCYAYTFGLLLVLSLYRRYRVEGDAFVPRYLRILSYGGSKAPIEILDEAGFDVRSASFWQGGFDGIAEMIDELEASAGAS